MTVRNRCGSCAAPLPLARLLMEHMRDPTDASRDYDQASAGIDTG